MSMPAGRRRTGRAPLPRRYFVVTDPVARRASGHCCRGVCEGIVRDHELRSHCPECAGRRAAAVQRIDSGDLSAHERTERSWPVPRARRRDCGHLTHRFQHRSCPGKRPSSETCETWRCTTAPSSPWRGKSDGVLSDRRRSFSDPDCSRTGSAPRSMGSSS